MKRIFILCNVVLTLMVLTGLSFAQERKDDTAIVTDITINIPTIKCGSCVKTVTMALKELDGVKEIHVDKKTKTAVVKYDAAKLRVVDLETAIAKSGYDANEVRRDKKAYEQLDSCCK